MGNTLVLVGGGLCLAFTLRNLMGAPSRFGLVTGWIAMVAFATLTAFLFWKARELKLGHAPSDVVWNALRLQVGCALALILSATGVGVQRRKMKRPGVTSPS